MSEAGSRHPVAPLCELLGFSRQAFYKRHLNEWTLHEADILNTSIVLYCQYLRLSENLPRAGFRELYVLCKQHFGQKFSMGRDRFCRLLRANDLMLRKRRLRPKTTDSRHRFHCYEDLLNTEPKLMPEHPGELVVADITYIVYRGGFAYLSLLSDAYSRCIVGHCLHPTLEVEGCLIALGKAFEFYRQHRIDTTGMIHHSDRGIQYASTRYTALLRKRGCRISMTQTGDPLHNALAERMNNTLKNSWHISHEQQSFREAELSVERAIRMYNRARPHQALGAKTPMQILDSKAQNPLLTPEEELPRIAPGLYRKMNALKRRHSVGVNPKSS